ncbi:MAG: hypothetical protein ABFC31_09720 [Clostridiaceae bacterium]
MRNEIFTAFDALSPAETEALLKHFDSLPIDHKAARRIRRSVESASVLRAPRRRTAKRALLAVASFLAVLVLLGVCFPAAAKAVASFFGINYTPTRYLTTLPETRTSIPAVEEALDAAAPAEGSYTITLLSDWDNAAEYEAYRAEQGLAPFAESDWNWLRDIRPEVAEVLYDGTALMWNVNLYTTSSGVEAFMRGYIDSASEGQNVDALASDVTYTVEGDPTVYTMVSSGGGTRPIFDEADRKAADHVTMFDEITLDPEHPLPDGVITVTETIRIAEGDAMSETTALAKIVHTFTFDTTTGNIPAATADEQRIPLSGETYLSIYHRETGADGINRMTSVNTEKVSLDGVVLSMSTEYLSTGTQVEIRVAEAPESWTEDMKTSLLFMTWPNTDGTITSAGVSAKLVIDGEPAGDLPMPDRWGEAELLYLLPIFSGGENPISSAVLHLSYSYYTTLNDTDQLAGEALAIPEDGLEFFGVTNTVPFAEIPVPLP